MAQVEATTQREIAARPDDVFDALADYGEVREKLLPGHFSEYEVREGGDGEGTVVHWKLQATSKRIRDCLMDVTEPTDGELVEKDRNSSMVTTWRVTPGNGEGTSRVTVTTVWNGAGGIGGFFEKTFAPKGLARIYDELLGKLAAETEKAERARKSEQGKAGSSEASESGSASEAKPGAAAAEEAASAPEGKNDEGAKPDGEGGQK